MKTQKLVIAPIINNDLKNFNYIKMLDRIKKLENSNLMCIRIGTTVIII